MRKRNAGRRGILIGLSGDRVHVDTTSFLVSEDYETDPEAAESACIAATELQSARLVSLKRFSYTYGTLIASYPTIRQLDYIK